MKLFAWLRRGRTQILEPATELPTSEGALLNLRLGHAADKRPLGDDEWAAIDRLQARGREHDVMELLRRVVAALPDDLAATLRLCEILCGRLEHTAAVPLLERLLPSPIHRERALILLAEGAERAGDRKAALAHYERVLARRIDHPRARAAADRLRPQGTGSTAASAAASITLDGPAQVSTPVAGRYRLLDELGRGASGAVYLAEDEEVGRQIALKILHPRAGDATVSARRRVWQEARAAACVHHPGVAAIYDLDEERGMIAMELCKGGSLRDSLRHGPLPAVDALRAWVQLAEALHAAHLRGVVHGDVKPANVLLRRALDERGLGDDDLVLCDFGVAKLSDEDQRATQGTLVYMAPEQRRGELTSRADLFAAGMVALELLGGPEVIAERSQDRAALLRGNAMDAFSLDNATRARLGTVADDVEALLRSMFSTDPLRRPTADRVAILAHASWVSLDGQR